MLIEMKITNMFLLNFNIKALKFFTESFRIRRDENSEAYIIRCKKMLGIPIMGDVTSKPKNNNMNFEKKESNKDEKVIIN